MDKNNRNLLIAGIAIVVVIALAIIIPHIKGSAVVAPTTDTTTTTDTSTTPATPGTTMTSLEPIYQKYNGKLVVFDANCNATPTTQIQPLGTRMALVNNSSVMHTIIFGDSTGYKIAAYHYKTVLIPTSSVINISCDAIQKAAAITVKG